MTKKLITLGDSWVYGDELGDDEHRNHCCWPALVAKHFQLELQNLAFNGESQQSAIWSMLWWIENHFDRDALIILGLTDCSRVSWFRASHATDTVPGHSHINIVAPFDQTACHQLKKIHLGMSACEHLHRYNRSQTVLFFDGLSMMYHLPVIYFDLYPGQPAFFGCHHAYQEENASDWVGSNTKPLGHPDENGHIIIADKLIYWIESAKML